ncbi:MAG: polymerase subunit sigma-70 [Frankiales bacterium]|nr:polymerase subunit sigma-70 [Frankiales bacterium]
MSTLHDLPLELPQQPAPRLRLVPDVPDVPDVPLAFEEAVRAVTPRLQRYVLRRLGDRHEAEELVQEALLRAYQHADTLRTEDDLAAWTTVVAGRLVIDRLRVRGRSTSVADVPEGARTSRDTADVVVARDEARTALDALDALPPRQASVLWAREVEGLAYDAIGERFGLTEPAVRSLLTRARKGLRKEFAVRGGTLPAGGLAALAPWVDGMSWLDRLRRLASRAGAPAVVAVLGAGVLGGALVAPWTLAAPDARPAVVRSSTTSPAPAARTAAPAGAPLPASAAAPEASRPVARVATPSRAVAPSPHGLPALVSRVDRACVGGPALSAGGYACGHRTGDELLVTPGVPLPAAVDALTDGAVGAKLPASTCRTLTPVIDAVRPLPVRCTPQENP